MGNFKDFKRYLEEKNIKNNVISYIKSKAEVLAEMYSNAISSAKGFIKSNGKKVVKSVAAIGAVAIMGTSLIGCGTQVEHLEGHSPNCKGGEVRSWGTPVGILYCNCQKENGTSNKPADETQSSQPNADWVDTDWANIIPGEKKDVAEDKKPAPETTKDPATIIIGEAGETHVGNSVPETKKEDVKTEPKETESSELIITGAGGETHVGSSVPETEKEDVKVEPEKSESDFSFEMEIVG